MKRRRRSGRTGPECEALIRVCCAGFGGRKKFGVQAYGVAEREAEEGGGDAGGEGEAVEGGFGHGGGERGVGEEVGHFGYTSWETSMAAVEIFVSPGLGRGYDEGGENLDGFEGG